MALDILAEMNSRIYDPKWDTQERLDMRGRYDAKYGADIKYLPTSWIDIVGPVLDELVDSYPGTTFRQVKEKFGYLRVYVDPHNSELEHMLESTIGMVLTSRDVYANRP